VNDKRALATTTTKTTTVTGLNNFLNLNLTPFEMF